MKKPEKTIILLTLFTISTLISIITVYAVHQTPTEKTITNTLCTYTSTATYNYTATLEPNTIYNNKTTLKPNEGTLYQPITKQINITLTYTFHANVSTETTITYSLTQTLKTAAWTHQIATTTPPPPTNKTQIQIPIPPINKNALQTIKSKIETETGTTASTYSLQISPTFTINANTTVGSIQQTFTPTLTIDFKHTDQGNIITIEDLHQTKSGAITQNQTITRYDIINQRYASYILIAISAAGTFSSAYFYKKTRPLKPTKPTLEELIKPYQENIIHITEPPLHPTQQTIITVNNLEDLQKIAEQTLQPILHHQQTKT
ncbi:MAG: DUF5305 family protein, partial [Thermoproteota archaeon]|nr:DUF5305 family protein [Thermoproteota archaeon]